ncbi:hypothetical protein GDO86_011159 [Hymenochirus boettgeri]|uniref:Suppressor of cytokine signaling 6 n=1 Tax=Hymenochirus boettgeri TaxID=247094 RepID=A0A8T2JD47_9PIPI|nr:hypothetical protein GDO86_011159 [Hymenochirus boettgeri]
MKKISLKTFRKSFNLNKSKDENDFVTVPQQSMTNNFVKDDSLFSSYDISEEEKTGKNRPKSESLMGTLKRRLSAKQKQKGKSSTSGNCAEEDTFSSSSAPITFKDCRAQRPLRSTSLRTHHYSPTPWPLRPTNSEETCIKMDVKVKALVHSSSPSPALNGVRKDFHELQTDNVFLEQGNPLKSTESQNGELRLHINEHVPVVIGLMPQDYIQYTVPLDEGMYPLEESPAFCLDGSSPMEISTVPSQVGSHFHEEESQVTLDVAVAPDIFVDQAVNGLLHTTNGTLFHNSIVNHNDAPPLSPLLPPVQSNQIQRNFAGLHSTDGNIAENMRCHLNFDPNTAPGVGRVFDSVQRSGPMVVTSLTEELKKLARQGWYWGPITRWEAEEKLANVSVTRISNLPSKIDKSGVKIYAGAVLAIPVPLCHTSIHKNRPDSKTAFTKQNEGLFTGKALLNLKAICNLHFVNKEI